MESKRLLNTEYYYLSDHLGSIRVVLNEQGNVDSWSDYYPFGKESRGSNTSNEPKEQFTGKERDIEIGLDYFGARYYNFDIGRWMSADPMGRKYPNLSTYTYSANNPLNIVDIDGRDIIVLVDKQGASGTGHQAVLIGNDKSGWTYISKDGSTGNIFGSNSIYTIKNFSSIDDFRNSMHNFELAEGKHSDDKGNENSSPIYQLDESGDKIQRYDEAYQISTISEDGNSTDENSIKAASTSAKSEYVLGESDCSDVISSALSVGISSEGKKLQIGEDMTKGGWLKEFPRKKQNEIMNKNSGKNINIFPTDKKLKDKENGSKD